jgi:hypothetical protein
MLGFIHELAVLLHVYHVIPLVYQDVGILDFSLHLLELLDLLLCVSTALNLGNVEIADKRLIITTEGLVEDDLGSNSLTSWSLNSYHIFD